MPLARAMLEAGRSVDCTMHAEKRAEQEGPFMSRIEKPVWTRIFLAAFALGTLGLLGSAIAVAEHTHASIAD